MMYLNKITHMRKFAQYILAIFLILPIGQINALEALNLGMETSYKEGDIIEVELYAKPEASENAVTVNIRGIGVTFIEYTPPTNTDWIGVIADCTNGKTFTENQICVSLAKAEDIEDSESLGIIKVKITDLKLAKITKSQTNGYSDGERLRKDTGDLIFLVNKVPENTQSTTSEISSENATLELDVAILALLTAIAILLLTTAAVAYLIFRKNPKNIQYT